MPRIVDEIVRLPLDAESIAGRLYADQQGWSFSSSDAAFREIIPSGALHSFRDYGMGAIGKRAAGLKKTVEGELRKMLTTNVGAR
jgi:hypothetical protein